VTQKGERKKEREREREKGCKPEISAERKHKGGNLHAGPTSDKDES
jgi:hypothetical protein